MGVRIDYEGPPDSRWSRHAHACVDKPHTQHSMLCLRPCMAAPVLAPSALRMMVCTHHPGCLTHRLLSWPRTQLAWIAWWGVCLHALLLRQAMQGQRLLRVWPPAAGVLEDVTQQLAPTRWINKRHRHGPHHGLQGGGTQAACGHALGSSASAALEQQTSLLPVLTQRTQAHQEYTKPEFANIGRFTPTLTADWGARGRKCGA